LIALKSTSAGAALSISNWVSVKYIGHMPISHYDLLKFRWWSAYIPLIVTKVQLLICLSSTDLYLSSTGGLLILQWYLPMFNVCLTLSFLHISFRQIMFSSYLHETA
jgi:hypothetical protein